MWSLQDLTQQLFNVEKARFDQSGFKEGPPGHYPVTAPSYPAFPNGGEYYWARVRRLVSTKQVDNGEFDMFVGSLLPPPTWASQPILPELSGFIDSVVKFANILINPQNQPEGYAVIKNGMLTNSLFDLAGSCGKSDPWNIHTHPCFWSGFWMEKEGTEAEWRHDFNDLCHGHLTQSGLGFEPGHPKHDVFKLLHSIGGVALQVNVQMDADPTIAKLRDDMWGSKYGGFKGDLAEQARQWVGMVMSSIYANTVLSKYTNLDRKDIYLIEGNFNHGGKSLRSDQITDIVKGKFFNKAEWPRIKTIAKHRASQEWQTPVFRLHVVCEMGKENTELHQQSVENGIRAALGNTDNLIEFRFVFCEAIQDCLDAKRDSQAVLDRMRKGQSGGGRRPPQTRRRRRKTKRRKVKRQRRKAKRTRRRRKLKKSRS